MKRIKLFEEFSSKEKIQEVKLEIIDGLKDGDKKSEDVIKNKPKKK